ncbi:putative mfs transporter protein [Venturia nashicola]|uniref:Putative mfs transporter protein n=1 Tax=Venturia nashicola TaxID=86259 RepID=A0A4Z1PHN8_9PEZI|nr:putative mfs transporter protein [Venturia nashicola]
MGLGVLEDRKLQQVPGTSVVVDDDARRAETNTSLNPNLKYDRTGSIILVPQPSDDPNDPLNWPLWRRDLILFLLSLLGIIASTLSPLLAADSVSLALHYRRTFNQVALLTGYHLLGVGIGGFIFVPSSRIWGKRHAFIIGTVIIIFSSVWGGKASGSFASMTWARVFQGIGLAPFEALVNAAVGDLYFVHERGVRMAISNFAVFGGAFMTPVVVGKMAHTMGWEWSFYFIAIFTGAFLPVLFFFVPETAYRRDARFNSDTAIGLRDMHQNGTVDSASDIEKRNLTSDQPYTRPESTGVHTPKVKYSQTLWLFNGRKSDESFWKLALRPLPLFVHPGIAWACLIQGTLIGWTVFLGIVLGAIMLGPPLFFSEVQTGYMYTGAFVGAVVGFIISGLLADSVPNWLTRKNRGVYEPEFRLPLVFPMLILGCAGLYGFGITSENTYRYGWFWPDFFFALEVAGMVVGAVASSTYIVDAHREISVEAFTCMMIFKNIFSFGLTYKGYDWLVAGEDYRSEDTILILPAAE